MSTGRDLDHVHLLRVLYVSAANGEPDDAEHAQLLAQARERNESLGVTGLLLYKDGLFMQFLEGAREDVEAVYASITRDPRHAGVRTILSGTIERRIFQNWSMAFIRLDDVAVAANPGFSDFLERSGQDALSLGDDVGLWMLEWFRDRGFPSVFEPALAS